jgi:acyl-CoA hydrolase
MASPPTIAETRTVVQRIMMPMDANPSGNVYGGSILKYIDEVATIIAVRHTRTNVVTASIDRMDFLAPMHVGDILILRAAINFTGRTSMEVGVRVEAEDPHTARVVHAGSCYLTMVALDASGHPTRVPPVTPTTPEERAWFENGKRRRDQRLKLRERLGHD